MRVKRGLLVQGNRKVGEAVHVWNVPAVETCPGSSETCRRVCYATRGRFRLPGVRERLRWNLEQSDRADFAARMAREVRRKGCLVVRVHGSGDFGTEGYAAKWLDVLRRCPRPRFYWYSRGWRVPGVAAVLERMAALPNCRAWYSADRDTGLPDRVPAGVRVAYLQAEPDEPVPDADLVFRVRTLRAKGNRTGLPTVCPSETPRGQSTGVTCGSCGRCFE